MLRSDRIPQREIEAAVERALQIQGLFHRDEARFLYRLARRKGEIVEIGCWRGRTTAILLQAATVWGATVTTIDPFKVLSPRTPAGSRAIWETNLRRVGLVPPRLLEMTSDEASAVYEGKISFLFIDGDHGKAGVLRDLANWAPRVKVGGVMAWHDAWHPGIPGVATGLAEWWGQERRYHSWEMIGQHDHTIAFRRLR